VWHTNQPTVTGANFCHLKLETHDLESSVVGFQKVHSYDCCELDGPGIESQWGRYFLHPARPALGSTQPHIQWALGIFSQGYSGQGVALTTHPHLTPRLKKEYSYTATPLGAFMAYSTMNFTVNFMFTQLRLQKDLLLRTSVYWVISYYGLEFRLIKVYRYTSVMQLVR
jgi:hypothetical protein